MLLILICWMTFVKKNIMKFNEIDMQFIEPVKYDSDEEKVLRIIKGDFEYIFGISLEKFNEVYHNILKNCPEKLI